ncbi:MAG: class I SAM-dependent methyltransferase [Planctomycetes bacterium]|nr:class I SAM-dependent methyltransferase [Planctomycetota bacterium]
MTNFVLWCLSRANLRVMRLSSYRKVMRQLHRPAPAPREHVPDTESDERFAREATQCEPVEIPRVPGSFFIKVKVDYPGVFRPNPADYVYQPVAELFERHKPDIDRNVKLLVPHMYCDALDELPTARVNDVDPHWGNGMFERDDARTAYAIAARLRPRRILEVGSGNSTKFFRMAIRDHNINCELVCVDPQPRAEIGAVADRIIYKHVKDVDAREFAALRDGDILFWDGSHIAFNGTDTTHLYLSLLPLIKRNVYVHVHDIQLPFEYESGYSAHYYNEQYLLATLLLNSSEWKPVLPVHWLHSRGRLRHGGASLWMARQHL